MRAPKAPQTASLHNGAVSAVAEAFRDGALPAGAHLRLGEALKKQFKRYRKGLRRCQEKFSGDAVHKSRIETRRLLSLLELLGPFLTKGRLKKAQLALKHHLDTFDDLRDTHVQLKAVGKMKKDFPAATPFCHYLRKREERFTCRTRRNIKCIRTKRLGKLITRCRQEVREWRGHRQPGEASARLLAALVAAFVRTRSLKERIDPGDTGTIHCTRVAFKRFRYMIETLAAEWPLANPKLLARMRGYQTMMGEVQDAEVLLRAWRKFGSKKRVPPSEATPFEAELAHRREGRIRVYLEAADQLLTFWPPHPASSPLLRSGRRTPPGNGSSANPARPAISPPRKSG